MKRQAGFTLIELLITISIVGFLVAVAVPNFKLTIQNNRLVSQANDLLGAFIYARSQAIALNTTVTICASSDGAACSSDWASGWVIKYTDSSSTVQYLRKHEALTGSNTLTSTIGSSITFASSGLSTTSGYFTFCDTRGAGSGRSLYLNSTGFARLSTTAGKKIDGSSIGGC